MLIRARMIEYGLMRIEYEEAKQRALGMDAHNSWCKSLGLGYSGDATRYLVMVFIMTTHEAL